MQSVFSLSLCNSAYSTKIRREQKRLLRNGQFDPVNPYIIHAILYVWWPCCCQRFWRSSAITMSKNKINNLNISFVNEQFSVTIHSAVSNSDPFGGFISGDVGQRIQISLLLRTQQILVRIASSSLLGL